MFERVKLKIAALACTAILLTSFISSSLAFYTVTGRVTNVVTTGAIQFMIHETTKGGEAFPQNGVTVVPGDVVEKKVSVENDCEHPFYLRIRIDSAIEYDGIVDAEAAVGLYSLDINEEHWDYVDGWYYYKSIVEPGAFTHHLFSNVSFDGQQIDNSYIGKKMSLTILAQAVQSENNPIENGMTSTAHGWPQA